MKKNRIGEINKNKQGLTMQIVKYYNRNRITIEFLENGERCNTNYNAFRKGLPTTNLWEHPSRTECSFKQALWTTIGILSLIMAAFAGLIYYICK